VRSRLPGDLLASKEGRFKNKSKFSFFSICPILRILTAIKNSFLLYFWALRSMAAGARAGTADKLSSLLAVCGAHA
jgi:hypothetical protein